MAATKFSFEVPIRHLQDFDKYQDFFFGLSYLLDDPVYNFYFRSKCQDSVLTILDNGFNETLEPAQPGYMAQLWVEYGPNYVVSPDADWWTPEQTKAAFNTLKKLISSTHIMTVFRNDVERAYFESHSLGVQAASFEWAQQFEHKKLGRVHILGLHDVHEVRRTKPYSLDTSQCVKWALRGISFEDWLIQGGQRPAKPALQKEGNRLQRALDYFNLRLTDAQCELAAHNMEAIKAFVNLDQPSDGQCSKKTEIDSASFRQYPYQTQNR